MTTTNEMDCNCGHNLMRHNRFMSEGSKEFGCVDCDCSSFQEKREQIATLDGFPLGNGSIRVLPIVIEGKVCAGKGISISIIEKRMKSPRYTFCDHRLPIDASFEALKGKKIRLTIEVLK